MHEPPSTTSHAGGVTKSTVSHASQRKASGRTGDPAAHREAIAALGYRPNPLAQRLAAGRAGRSGLCSNAIQHRPVRCRGRAGRGGVRRLSAAGFALILFGASRRADQLQPFLETACSTGSCSGRCACRTNGWQRCAGRARPFVMMGRTADNGGLSFVDVDIEAGVERAWSTCRAGAPAGGVSCMTDAGQRGGQPGSPGLRAGVRAAPVAADAPLPPSVEGGRGAASPFCSSPGYDGAHRGRRCGGVGAHGGPRRSSAA